MSKEGHSALQKRLTSKEGFRDRMWQPLDAVTNVIAAHLIIASVVDADIQYIRRTIALLYTNEALEPTFPAAETFRSHTTCETTRIS